MGQAPAHFLVPESRPDALTEMARERKVNKKGKHISQLDMITLYVMNRCGPFPFLACDISAVDVQCGDQALHKVPALDRGGMGSH